MATMMTTASISGNNNHNNNAANGFRPNCSPLSSSNNYNHDNSNSKSFLSPSRTVITSFTPRRPTCYVGAGDATTLSPYEEGDWVLCLTTDCCPNNSRLGGSTGTAAESLACALSNGEIQVYDAQRLHLVRSYRHHHHHHHHPSMNHKPQQNHNNATTTTSTTCVTDLQYGPQKHIILSAGQDGMVNLFDLRSSSQAQQAQAQIRLPPASSLASSSLSSKALCMALGYDGTILAVGSTKGRIHFWDWRQPQTLLGTYGNSHKDDVTCLQFSNAHNNNNNNNSLLLSGSEDGLVCLLDTTQATEELALQSIVNVHAPIRKAGFCGNHHPSFYCLTGNETLHLYQSDSGSVCQQQQQQFARDHFWNATTTTTTTTTTTSPATTSISHHHDSMWASIDYLVDAYWDQTHNQLLVLAGGRQASSSSTVAAETGNSALFAIVDQNNHNHKPNNHENAQGAWMSSSSSSWKIQHQESFVGGHNGVLRAWCPLGKSATGTTTSTTDGGGLFSSIVTAGEDARLCEWHIPPSTASAKIAAAAASSFAGTKRPNGSPTNQHHHGGGSGGGGPFRRQRHKTSTSPY